VPMRLARLLPSIGGSGTRGSSKSGKTSASLQLKNASAVERFGGRPNRLRSAGAPGCSINALNRYRLDQGGHGALSSVLALRSSRMEV
jgi:hypothetical protein